MRQAVALLALLLATAVPTAALTGPPPMREATVIHVDDGDTIEVLLGDRVERVRYIGIDAPEIPHEDVGGERGGQAAARLNRALVGGRRVRLEFDYEERDRYGRLLAYLWLGDTMINLELVRRGYARALTIPPNLRHERWFVTAESEARAAGRGLWGSADLEGQGAAIRAPMRSPPRSATRFEDHIHARRRSFARPPDLTHHHPPRRCRQ
jgi:endonuclease YncB( thermonuclease family)